MACLRGGGRLRRLTTTGFGTSDPFPPLPAVRPADVPDLYLERQREAFCGLHALNAALGSPVFTQEDIDCAAQRVLDCAIAAAMNNTESCEETLARHRSPAGMYSEQALGEALAHDGRWRMDDQSWYLPPVDALALMPRDDIVGAIAYTPGHWVALRTVDGGLWLLDSLKRWPQRLGSVGDPAAKAFLESCERVFLLCSDQGVAPTNQELTDGTPGSAAAMAEASRLSPPPPEVATSKAQPRVSRSRSPRRELAPCDHALPAVLPDGARGVRSHAEQLLQVYASGGDARHFLRSLPLVHPDVAALTPELSLHLSALGLDGLAENRLAAAEALRLSTPLWRTTAYPLAVLCEAMSIAQGMPAVFYHDTFLALFGSLLHKDLAVSIGGWECRSRFWVVGTADPGGGKSAAVDPMRDLLDSVLQEFPDLAPGSRFGRFHFCGPCTHAAAADRLRENDGYLAVVSGEAGPLLCPSWASSLRWEPSGYMNLSKFLDAAGGGSFQWETKNDRGVKRRGAATEEEERGCIDIARTNVSFALFQQVSIFTDWWARSESGHPIGLAPRFLFAFGSSLPPTHARHARFVQEVAFPLLADVWRQLLRVLGPRVPVTTKHPCRQWTLGGDAEDFVLRLRTLCHDTGRKLSGRSIVATALTKVNYILGQQCLLQELLAQLLPAALAASTVPTELRPVVQWHTLSLAWEFARLRYLFGQAVLDQDIRQQSWAISGGVPEVFAGATTHQRQAALVLRHCTGQEIAVDDMADVGPPFRAARSSSQHLRSAALGAAASLFEHMALAGLGAVVHSESGHAVFQKQHWQHLSDEAKGYLHRARVPPWTFGYGILQAREKLQQRQAAATTPVALHCVTAADRQSTAHGDGASHADAGTHLAAGTASAGQPIVEAAEPTDVDAGTQTSSVPTTHTLSLPAPRRIPGLWDGLSMAELRTRPASREVVSQGGTMQLPTTEQTAAAAVATTQPMPRFAWLREAGDHLWSRSDVRALIGQRLKEENVRAEVTLRGETAYVWRFRARCSQPQCLWQWNVQYFFRRQGHPPGTLLAYSIGDHSHATLTTTAASGRIFTPRQQQAAEEYVAGSSRRSARQLRAFLDSRGESGLPTDTQLSEWLRRAAKRQKQAEGGREQPESQHVVAVVAESVERWVRDAGEQPEELFVLRSFKLSGDAAFVPFLSSGMVATMARLRDADVCLVVDTKMGVLDKGWGIATVSVLVKDALRMTTLSRDSRPLVSGEGASRAQGTRRVQGRAWTSHAMPLLQAIIHSESASNYIALFEQLEHVWAGARFNDKPLKVWPAARPVDDFFHFREKRRAIESRLRKAVPMTDGRLSKEWFGWIEAALNATRFAPSAQAFHLVWNGLLQRLLANGESVVAEYFMGTYTRTLPAELLASSWQIVVNDPEPGEVLSFCGHWSGVLGIAPGMSCGSQPAEALHRAWQAFLVGQQRSSPAQVLRVMQRVYERWSVDYAWTSHAELSRRPRGVDPGLLNSVVLGRVGRSTAVDFQRAHEAASASVLGPACVHHEIPGQGVFDRFFVMPRLASGGPVAADDAGVLVTSLVGSTARMRDAFTRAGVLEHSDDGSVLHLSAYRRIFIDIVCVAFSGAESACCTCDAFAVHAQCEHLVFASSLPTWPGSAAMDLRQLPARRQTGRPRGSGKAAAAKAKAIS